MSEAEDKKKEKPADLESVAEETGEVIGKGIKKTWDVVKSFGKGLADTIDCGENGKEPSDQHCTNCEQPVSAKSNFCANCGKKL